MDKDKAEAAEKQDRKADNRHRPAADPVTIAVYAGCAVIFGAFVIHGLISGGDALPADTEITETSAPATSSVSVSGTSAARTLPSETKTTASLETITLTSKTSQTETYVSTAAPVTSSKKTSVTTKAPVMSTTAVTTVTTTTAQTAPSETTSETETTTTTAATTTSTTTETTTTTAFVQSFPADINTITYEGLLQVPGIGEKTAREIIDYRERHGTIHNLEELKDLPGIGDEKVKQFGEYLYVSPDVYKEMTTTTTTTTTAAVTAPPVTAAPERQPVHINYADEEEIAEKLLLPIEKARAIVELREQITAYSSVDELYLLEGKGLTKEDIQAIKDYIIID